MAQPAMLPNPERTVVDLAKLRDYCLSPTHETGKHKARVFAAALGLTAMDAEDLRAQLLAAARTLSAAETEADDYGRRFVIDLTARGPRGHTRIRSCWLVRAGEDFARLTSCYVI